MKLRTFIIRPVIAVTALAISYVTASAQGPGRGRGMPAEAREAIHGLFDASDEIKRTVKQTDDGYVSRTVSKNPVVVKILQTHVKQMEARLKKGMMVRRWDPAYEEFVNHYDDIDIKITNIENGVSITAVGKTEDARKVARNHAGIISKFIQGGWDEHDKAHPAVLAKAEVSGASGEKAAAKPCCLAAEQDGQVCAECVRKGAEISVPAASEQADAKPCCKKAKKGGEACAECAKHGEAVVNKDCCPSEGAATENKPCCKDKETAEQAADAKS